MSNINEIIRRYALMRISKIFNIQVESLTNKSRFGEELKVSFVSDFRYNEFDQVDDDIHSVADRRISKEMSAGMLIIGTVGDYCEHMVRCYKTKPNDVKEVLGILKIEDK